MRERNIDSRLSFEEFIKSFSSIVGLDQLLENFSAKLKEMLDASSVYIILYEPITNRYVGKKAKGENAEVLKKFNFAHSDNLMKWLTVNQCPLEVKNSIEVVKFLSPYEQELLHDVNILLVVPLIVVNRLTGAIFVCEKQNGGTYTPPEINRLSVLTSQSALAIEYSLMYQFQEDKLTKLFHADKLTTVGELAAGAAHEIRNPLTSIRSTIQYLRKDLPAEKKQLVDGIIEEVDRIDQVIKGLLSFSKTSELHMGDVDIEDIIDQTLLLLESEFKKYTIEIQKTFDASDKRITGDASQLKQLFLNILLNAIQAMPKGGTINVMLSEHPGRRKTAQTEEFVCVEITDTGCGITETELPKVFDPFYTTKETGTGLGLSISYGIVTKHSGEIEISSAADGPRRGTRVVIRLPRALKID